MFWFNFPLHSTKQKITGTRSCVLGVSRAPFYKNYHSVLPAAEDRAISLVSPLGEVIGDTLSGV